jgi:phosphocarrier protein
VVAVYQNRDGAEDRETQVLRREFTIRNKLGLHARAAARIVQTTDRFQSNVRMIKSDQEVDASSILDILSLSCAQGTKVEVRAEGDDAPEAMAALAVLFENKFGEE